ncbi:hypothetical protein ACQEVS_33015 [Streptomyces sp. CA-181903]|uniref:hypothetical protein n=1 Tax=Streptomyces sp. CA-181903 TaxID=3240055 RepID=UPI003D8E33A9
MAEVTETVETGACRRCEAPGCSPYCPPPGCECRLCGAPGGFPYCNAACEAADADDFDDEEVW